MRLRPDPNVPAAAHRLIDRVAGRLPSLEGRDIRIDFYPQLRAYRGKLLTGVPQRGIEVHAAAFIRQRRIVLESSLLKKPNTLRLILIHEIFHFVWARFGNVQRKEYAAILQRELEAGGRGELGESAGVKKKSLGAQGYWDTQSKLWRDYICESFCDTAAWVYSGVPQHAAFALASRWMALRRAWLLEKFVSPRGC